MLLILTFAFIFSVVLQYIKVNDNHFIRYTTFAHASNHHLHLSALKFTFVDIGCVSKLAAHLRKLDKVFIAFSDPPIGHHIIREGNDIVPSHVNDV